MKSQSHNNTQQRLLIRDLLGTIENALDEFWATHVEETEFSEDVLPNLTRDKITKAILEGAKSNLAAKRAQDLQKMTGDSRFASTLRGRMVDGYLEEATEGIENYFERLEL